MAESKKLFSEQFDLTTYDTYMKKRPLEQRIMFEYIMEKVTIRKVNNKKINNKKAITIIELGAGTGRFTKLFANQLKKSKIILVDPDAACCEILKKQFKYASVLNDAAESFKSKQKADIIVMATAFHHIPFDGKVQALRNINKSLAKDGWFLCGDNFLAPYNTMKERERVLRKSMKKWMQDARKSRDKKDIAMSSQMNNIVFKKDFGGEYFMCPNVFEEQVHKAGMKICGKANCSNTDPLDMEHYFYLIKK